MNATYYPALISNTHPWFLSQAYLASALFSALESGGSEYRFPVGSPRSSEHNANYHQVLRDEDLCKSAVEFEHDLHDKPLNRLDEEIHQCDRTEYTIMDCGQ